MLVAYPCAVLNMIMRATPALVDAFAPVRMHLGTPWEDASLRRVYSRLPSMDFSKRIVGTLPGEPRRLVPRPCSGQSGLAQGPIGGQGGSDWLLTLGYGTDISVFDLSDLSGQH